MNSPIAWLDGILAIFIFALGFLVLGFIFRNDPKYPDRKDSKCTTHHLVSARLEVGALF
jgi:hypothetical protein